MVRGERPTSAESTSCSATNGNAAGWIASKRWLARNPGMERRDSHCDHYCIRQGSLDKFDPHRQPLVGRPRPSALAFGSTAPKGGAHTFEDVLAEETAYPTEQQETEICVHSPIFTRPKRNEAQLDR